MKFNRWFFVALPAIASLAACGGAGSTTPFQAAVQAHTSVALNGSAGSPQTIALPGAGGDTGTMVLDLASPASGVIAAVFIGASPPFGEPAPPSSDQSIAFVGLSVSASVSLATFPDFTFTLSESGVASVRRSPQTGGSILLLDFFDPGDAAAGYQPAGTCSQSRDTVTCAGANGSVALVARQQYVFALTRQTVSATPAPTSTPPPNSAGGTTVIVVPTPAPVVCSPSSDIVGVDETNYIDCTAQGYGGPFAIAVADPTIASVQQANALTNAFFSVTGLRAGTTTLSLQTPAGGTGSVTITVAQ